MTYEQEQLFEAAKKLQSLCETFMCDDCPLYGYTGCKLEWSTPAAWDLDRMVEKWEKEKENGY